MAIIATQPKRDKYPLVPSDTYSAVCVDVIDEGEHEQVFENKTRRVHRVSLWWQLDEKRPDKDERFTIRKYYTLSLHKKSALYKDLIAWRGKPFTAEELEGFDLEKLIGVAALVTVVHEASKDGTETYANVKGVANPPKGMPRLKAENYTRRKDREGEQYDRDREAEPTGEHPIDEMDDASIPFALLAALGSGLIAAWLAVGPVLSVLV